MIEFTIEEFRHWLDDGRKIQHLGVVTTVTEDGNNPFSTVDVATNQGTVRCKIMCNSDWDTFLAMV